jgi:hypothetical protein
MLELKSWLAGQAAGEENSKVRAIYAGGNTRQVNPGRYIITIEYIGSSRSDTEDCAIQYKTICFKG